MGLFQGKQKKQDAPIDETSDGVKRFFSDYFQELRDRGETYFNTTVEERIGQFKDDLDITIVRANADLKTHIVSRLDEQFAQNSEAIKMSQDAAYKSLTDSAGVLQAQQKDLSDRLQRNIIAQEAMLSEVFEASKARIEASQSAQAAALTSLQSSITALEHQHYELVTAMEKKIAEQEAVLVHAFDDNMAQVVEHYLLGALGDQFDLKAQLPAIIKQMEANKKAIMDDIQL